MMVLYNGQQCGLTTQKIEFHFLAFLCQDSFGILTGAKCSRIEWLSLIVYYIVFLCSYCCIMSCMRLLFIVLYVSIVYVMYYLCITVLSCPLCIVL